MHELDELEQFLPVFGLFIFALALPGVLD